MIRSRAASVLLMVTLALLVAAVFAPAAMAAASPVEPTEDLAQGAALSMWKIIALVLLMMVVGATGNWLAGDVVLLQKNVVQWLSTMLAVAALALIIVLVVPWLIVGLLLALAMVGGVMAWYASWRNPLVPARVRIFTAAHAERVKNRLLRREQEGESAAERAVHVAARSQLTEQLKLVYMKTNDFPIRLRPENEQQEAEFSQAERLLHEALRLDAEELYLIPQGQQLQVRYRGDGILRDGGTVEPAQAAGVTAFFKRLADLDVKEHRKPQNGRLIVLEGERSTFITVEAAGSVRGEQLLMRLHPRELIEMRLEDSGMRPEQVAALREALNSPQGGMVLMGSPNYNRRLISMYAAMREFDLFSKNVMAVTTQISIEYPDIQQLEAGRQGGDVVAQTMQAALRADPDVVMLETLEEAAAAKVLINGAAAGKMMVAGLNANDAADAIEKFLQASGDVRSAASLLRAATNQRMMRKLCPGCREGYRPNPDFLRKANLQASQVEVLYREPKSRPVDKKGEVIVCPLCNNEGYHGRTFIYEVVVFDDEARRQLSSGKSLTEVRSHLRKQGQDFLQEEGLRKVVSGETSVTELLRVLKPAK